MKTNEAVSFQRMVEWQLSIKIEFIELLLETEKGESV